MLKLAGKGDKVKLTVQVLKIAIVLSFVTIESSYAQSDHHVMQGLAETQWGAAPPMLPAGAEIAVLAGNPMAASPYTIRLKFPAHYQIPAHSHPTDENVVVVSGALTFGMGDKLQKGDPSNKTLRPGGFALMPANMNHFAYSGQEPTTIVLYGQGPVEFKYVNPNDDPRNSKPATK
jgi:hypothetical protein